MSEYELTPARLAAMWDRHDPVPPGLVDKVVAALETEDLDAEYELLHLVERTRELAGARSGSDAFTIAFSGGSYSLLLRVSALGGKACRVDGWVTPAQPMRVSVSQRTKNWDAAVDGQGRFEIPRLPTGLTRFWLLADDAQSQQHSEQLFATPTFEL